jgi:hypothetical protein
MQSPSDPYLTILKTDDDLNEHLEAYFTHQQYGDYSALWNEQKYPKIENQYCSPVKNDRRRKIADQSVVVASSSKTYKELFKILVRTYGTLIDKKRILKHKVCFIQYLLSKHQTTDQTTDAQKLESDILYQLCRFVLLDSNWDEVRNFIFEKQQVKIPLFTDEDTELINNKIGTEVSVSTVLNLLKLSTQQLNLNIAEKNTWLNLKKAVINLLFRSKENRELHPLYSLCNTGGLISDTFPTDLETLNKTKTAVSKLLQLIGTDECTESKDDIYTLTEFKDLPFSELGTFFHLVKLNEKQKVEDENAQLFCSGHCFSIHQVVGQLFSQFGNITLGEIKIKEGFSEYFIKYIIPWIAYYYSHMSSDDPYHKQFVTNIKEYLVSYSTILDEETKKGLTDLLTEIQEEKFKAEADERRKLPMIAFFLKYLYDEHTTKVNSKSIVDVFDKVGDVLFNLIAYLGYACLSDDITSDANTGFSIADHCMQRTFKLIKTLKKIKIEIKTVTIPETKIEKRSFADLLKEIQVVVGTSGNSRSLQNLLYEASNECVHGVGIKLLTAYLFIYKTLLKAGKTPQLAPFFIEIPLVLKSVMNGFDYITCVRSEIKNHNDNPCSQMYVVDIFNPDVCKRQRLLINTDIMYPNEGDRVNLPIDFLLSKTSSEPDISIETKFKEILILKHFLSNKELGVSDILQKQISRIPYLFQQERRVGFNVYAKFCHHCCLVAGGRYDVQTNDRRSKRNQIYENVLNSQNSKPITPFDYIEGELNLNKLKSENINDFLRTFLAYHVDSNKFMLNTGFEVEDITKQNITFDTLNNLGFAEFRKGTNANSTPTVLNFNQNNVTRIFYYIRLLYKVLAPENYFKQITSDFVNINIDPTKLDRKPVIELWRLFERYYRAVSQELSFPTNLWKQLDSITHNGNVLPLDEYQNLLNALRNKPELHKLYKLLSKLRNHHIKDLEELLSDVKILKSSEIVNSQKLFQFDGYTIYLTNLFNELTLRIFNLGKCLSVVFTSDWGVQLDINTLQINPRKYFGNFYMLLSLIMSSIYGGGRAIGSYQYNFTEILRDLYFYEDLSKVLRSIQHSNPKRELLLQLKAVQNYILDRVPYYKNGKDTVTGFWHPQDLLEDVKDGALTVFDHWAKAVVHNSIKDNMVFKLSVFDQNYVDLISAASLSEHEVIAEIDTHKDLLEYLQMEYISNGGSKKSKSSKRQKSSSRVL